MATHIKNKAISSYTNTYISCFFVSTSCFSVTGKVIKKYNLQRVWSSSYTCKYFYIFSNRFWMDQTGLYRIGYFQWRTGLCLNRCWLIWLEPNRFEKINGFVHAYPTTQTNIGHLIWALLISIILFHDPHNTISRAYIFKIKLDQTFLSLGLFFIFKFFF